MKIWRLGSGVLALGLLGCAGWPMHQTPGVASPQATVPVGPAVAPPIYPPANQRHFEGRLSVTVHDEPTQHLTAEFELDGDAQAGELKLYGPVGGLVMVLQWEPGRAVLIEGDRRRVVRSVDWLIERVTGAKVSLPMVFDWLQGKPPESADWWVEPRLQANDRFRAMRLQPLPKIELILLLKPSRP